MFRAEFNRTSEPPYWILEIEGDWDECDREAQGVGVGRRIGWSFRTPATLSFFCTRSKALSQHIQDGGQMSQRSSIQ